MSAKIIKKNEKSVKIEVEIPFAASMLETEECIQQAVNEVGVVATGEALQRYDTDGSPIVMGDVKYYAKKKKFNKTYETPYGKVDVERHIYQTSKGGRTFCPLNANARIIGTATPKFAKTLSSKYTDMGATSVRMDLEENHGRCVAKSFIQNTVDQVGSIALAKEENWHYETPKLNEPVKTISIGLDGTTMFMSEDGFREAMVGTISLYDDEGERMHTTYIAARPEYGKKTFTDRLEREIKNIKGKYGDVTYIGLADGAADNWIFLDKHTEKQILDFYHASGYIGDAGDGIFGMDKSSEKKEWIEFNCHRLKHEDAANEIINDMSALKENDKLSAERKKKIESAITYFFNQKHRMTYAEHVKNNLPIGSGVTEAACKVIIKQRMCCSGMKWKERGAGVVLSLRCLRYSTGRWGQFWSKINQYGVPYDVKAAA